MFENRKIKKVAIEAVSQKVGFTGIKDRKIDYLFGGNMGARYTAKIIKKDHEETQLLVTFDLKRGGYPEGHGKYKVTVWKDLKIKEIEIEPENGDGL